MSEHDAVITLLKELDGPIEPRPEFAAALHARLLEELAQMDGAPARQGIGRLRWALPAGVRRPLLAGAAALAVAAIAIAVVVVSRPSPASALDVIRQARAAFAHMPPFQATYKFALNPDGTNPNPGIPRTATETVVVSYGGPRRFRAEVIAQRPPLGYTATGTYEVLNGRSLGIFKPQAKIFYSTTAPAAFRPLEFLSWRGASPDWERVCRGPYSTVLGDARIAGRDARHIRCGNFSGDVWELWIDRQTGLLLKLIGRVSGDDSFLGGGGPGTSAKGGFEIERLRYNPAFARRTFSTPPGAFDAAAALQATLGKVPPFRAVIATYAYRRAGAPGPISYVNEGWWLNEHTWREQRLLDRPGNDNFIGVGSFIVQAHGTTSSYNAHDNVFSRREPNILALGDPAGDLLGYLHDPTYTPARCPIVGHAQIDGRETDHRRCARSWSEDSHHHKTWSTGELWIDSATGLTLRSTVNGHDLLRVRSIEYHPRLPAGLFKFVPPPGSRDLYKLAANPYYKTRLAPGKPAPNWHATTLADKPFQVTDLRGKPTLLLLLPDWCGDDPACNDLAPLEQAYQKSNHRAQVVWVDTLGGTAQGAKKLARLDHFTLPIIIDHKDASHKAWGRPGYPYWLVLDARGRVIEGRGGLQTVAQLITMLAEQRAPR